MSAGANIKNPPPCSQRKPLTTRRDSPHPAFLNRKTTLKVRDISRSKKGHQSRIRKRRQRPERSSLLPNSSLDHNSCLEPIGEKGV
ncbi:hypothetical protein TELCIR_13978 [Teladorsagia circumcincta]|uniref:Uncharacterized protein n=1 Tax=Teladorsagia circumcincta TaxID=45464 RepID=A0A2G9U2H8_TELCI|nr:hypothetical protein TELCIR_13978 [Teladorsagia circumcincta]